MARTAIFVIDIQAELAQDPTTEIHAASRIREAGSVILAAARACNDTARSEHRQPPLLIIFVQHEEEEDSGTLLKGSRAWELVFPPREDDNTERLVTKTVRG